MLKTKNKFDLILGSQSPRRKELLQWIYIPYKIITSGIEELSTETNVEDLVMDLASQKAQDVFEKAMKSYNNPFVIGADTIVVVDDEVLGKPKSLDDAKKMLKQLAGRSHIVLTGVTFRSQNIDFSFFDKTEVHFDAVDDSLLDLYLDTKESLDKAGSYGIQGAALGFISKINGSYSNVVGLPVNLVLQNMKEILNLNEKELRDAFND
jgi:septum formation protein